MLYERAITSGEQYPTAAPLDHDGRLRLVELWGDEIDDEDDGFAELSRQLAEAEADCLWDEGADAVRLLRADRAETVRQHARVDLD